MQIRPVSSYPSVPASRSSVSANPAGRLNVILAQLGTMQSHLPSVAQIPLQQAINEALVALKQGDPEAIELQLGRFEKMNKMVQDLVVLQTTISLNSLPDEEEEEEDEELDPNSLLSDTRYQYQKSVLDSSLQALLGQFYDGPLGYDQQIKDMASGDVTDSLRNMLGL